MSAPQPQPCATWIVELATRLLPRGPVRDRYRHEFVAEMWGMRPGQQLQHALSVLVTAPALHRALVEAGELEFARSPLWCRLHLHHRWHAHTTDDGERYRRCLACGLDDDETVRRRVAGSMGIAHGTSIG